jgi:hypothetical protein
MKEKNRKIRKRKERTEGRRDIKEKGKRSYLESRLRTSRHRFSARVHETRSICNFKHFQVSLIVLETKINLTQVLPFSPSCYSRFLTPIRHANATLAGDEGTFRFTCLPFFLFLLLRKGIIISDILLVKHRYSSVQEVALSLLTAFRTVVGTAIRDTQPS